MATFTAIPEKTQTATAMKRVMDYVVQDKKTLFYDEQTQQSYRLIKGQHCVAETAYDEYMATKHQHNKAKGVFFKQYVQSFQPDCGKTPQEIHAMGMEMAKAFDGYEVLVATHIDADHWHNHLIVNSVSCETGLKIQIDEKELAELRNKSDEICKDFGMEILKPYQKPKKRTMNQREYRAALRGDSWKMKLITAIDKAVYYSNSKEQFIDNMKKMGYGVKWIDHYKYITYTASNDQKCRDNRLFDDKYLKSNMEEMFNEFKRVEGTQQRNDRYPDRAVSATVDWSKAGAMERSGEAHNNGWNRISQEYGSDIQAANAARSEQIADRRGAISPRTDTAEDYQGDELNKQRYEFQNDESQQFSGEYNDEIEFGYDGADENEGFDTSENQSKMGADWGDIALGAIALGAAIETMVGGRKDNEKQKKKQKQHNGKQRKKQDQKHKNDYDLSM
ncbi:MAG: hypothetical protein A2Y17_10235 [Clostridiales bacterium GWF2_38_85]|nr:MAG: hypothetical protein A2Y17_10235 [Clostridiales bacterium GWF2_38_85]HBL83295.1 relaxase [Clostridiales bacterium]